MDCEASARSRTGTSSASRPRLEASMNRDWIAWVDAADHRERATPAELFSAGLCLVGVVSALENDFIGSCGPNGPSSSWNRGGLEPASLSRRRGRASELFFHYERVAIFWPRWSHHADSMNRSSSSLVGLAWRAEPLWPQSAACALVWLQRAPRRPVWRAGRAVAAFEWDVAVDAALAVGFFLAALGVEQILDRRHALANGGSSRSMPGGPVLFSFWAWVLFRGRRGRFDVRQLGLEACQSVLKNLRFETRVGIDVAKANFAAARPRLAAAQIPPLVNQGSRPLRVPLQLGVDLTSQAAPSGWHGPKRPRNACSTTLL